MKSANVAQFKRYHYTCKEVKRKPRRCVICLKYLPRDATVIYHILAYHVDCSVWEETCVPLSAWTLAANLMFKCLKQLTNIEIMLKTSS